LAHSTTNTGSPIPGLVIVNYGKNQLLETAAGDIVRCVARRGLPQIVCGDEVEWLPTGDDSGVIETIKPRRTVLYRANTANSQRPTPRKWESTPMIVLCLLES